MKNAFSVFVFGSYEYYLPYYVYLIEKIYPDVDVVIFYNSTLSYDVKIIISNKQNVILYENFYLEYDFFKFYKMFGGGGKTLLRYLIPGKYFSKYNSVYFGDVDVLILKDKQNLFEFHKQQAKLKGVPFSNRVRLLPEGGISKRLTGLHFVLTKPYFELMDPLINNILNNENYRNDIVNCVNRDEEFLYYMNMFVFKFDPKRFINNKTPLHGFHLGVFRGKQNIHPNEIKDNSLLSYEEIKIQLFNLIQEKEFLDIMQSFYCSEMIRTLMYFKLKVPFNLKVKYFFKRKYDSTLLKKVRNKIKKIF